MRVATHPLQAEEFASDQPYNSESVAKETVQTELDQLGVSSEKTGNGVFFDVRNVAMVGRCYRAVSEVSIQKRPVHSVLTFMFVFIIFVL